MIPLQGSTNRVPPSTVRGLSVIASTDLCCSEELLSWSDCGHMVISVNSVPLWTLVVSSLMTNGFGHAPLFTSIAISNGSISGRQTAEPTGRYYIRVSKPGAHQSPSGQTVAAVKGMRPGEARCRAGESQGTCDSLETGWVSVPLSNLTTVSTCWS